MNNQDDRREADADLPEGWTGITTEKEQTGLVLELQAEVGADHPLAGIPMDCVARALGSDDVLFKSEQEASSGGFLYAQVHLTWRGGTEMPGFPSTQLFDSFEEWAASQTISPEEEAQWRRFNEQRQRKQQSRLGLEKRAFYLVVALAVLVFGLMIASTLAPGWFGL